MEKVEEQLLSVYKAANPSTYGIESNPQEYEYRKRFVSQLIENRLKLPRRIFSNASLLEFGAGTGEHSLFYLKWGAKGTFVDFNDDALTRMKMVFERFSIDPESYDIRHKSIYDFDAKGGQWDIVLAMGLLHHLKDKEAALEIAAKCVAPGGFLVLGVGTMAGLFQISLQRWAVRALAGDDDEKAYEIAESLFPEHIARSERFGRRSRRAIIFDSYINPKIDGFGLRELFAQIRSAGMTIYSSWPSHYAAARGDSAYLEDIDLLQTPELFLFPELLWMSHRNDDILDMESMRSHLGELYKGVTLLTSNGNELNSLGAEAVSRTMSAIDQIEPHLTSEINPYADCISRTQTLLREAMRFMRIILDGDVKKAAELTSSTECLFRGTSGIGINYFVAQRPHAD